MESLQNQINKYMLLKRMSESRRKIIITQLEQFLTFLCTGLKCYPSEVNLIRIYTVRDINGQIITHRPIDSKILDAYFYGLIPCTYNTLVIARGTLSAFLNWCERIYELPNPIKECSFNLKVYKPSKRPARVLSRHEVLRFFHCLVQHSMFLRRDLVLFCLLLSTGCRITEILTLKVFQINFESETFILPETKSGKPQIVILRKGMGSVLQLYCECFSLKEADLLFTVEDEPMSYNQAVKIFKEYQKLAKIPEINIHSTRHSFATHLFENGADISIIQQLLRHSDLQITMNYVHNNAIRNQGIKNKQNDELYRLVSLQGESFV